MTDTLLEARNLGHRRGSHTVLERVSLRLQAGEIVSVIGPNGAGKTTLLRLLLGLIPVEQGQVQRRTGLRIGYMPQRFTVDVQLPLSVQGFLRLSVRDTATVSAALEQTGVAHLAKHPLQQLSGGELQRVLLARASLNRPELLVLDEPAQGVDVTGQAELYRLITDLRDHLGCGVLLVSHDLHLVMASTDRVLCLNRHICCEGSPESVANHPVYRELFHLPGLDSLGVYTHHHNHQHDLHGNPVTPHDHTGCCS